MKKAPVYIFDDSFSALDFKTDAKLRRALTKYTENAVVLIVAQRVSTIMNAEQIIVLDEEQNRRQGHAQRAFENVPGIPRDCGKSAFKGGIGMSEPKRNAPRPHGPGRGMMPIEKAKDFKDSFKKLISYLSPFKFKILIVVIFAALSTVFTIVGPKILAKATDELTAGLMRIITGAAEGIDFGYIAKVLLFLVGLYALSALFSHSGIYDVRRFGEGLVQHAPCHYGKKIDRLPVSYFHKTSQGDVLSRITN